MAVNIHNLIAAIVPDVFCDPSVRKEVKDIAKKEGISKAAEKAKPFIVDEPMSYDSMKQNPLKNWGLRSPIEQHKLKYDSTAEGLEPIYFWILDFLGKSFKQVDKISDNFVSSPGSTHFSELGQKATIMQKEGAGMLGNVNQVLKSVLNLLYDLRDFRLRLKPYDKYKSGDAAEKESSILSLKQIWMDTVDVKRGTGSLNGLAQQLDFVTIRDAFMAAENVDLKYKGKEIDLNERVKRILKQRVREFFEWLDESEKELRKRYEIEKRYLQSQVNTLKLYSRWARPYLEAANKLEQHATPTAALVTTFNTIILELTLLAKDKYEPEEDVNQGNLPKLYNTISKKKYNPVVIVEFNFRGIPSRQGQSYTFGGITEMTFTSYALTDQEIKKLKEEMDKDNFNEIMQLIEGATTDSINKLQDEIDEYLDEDKKDEEKKKKEEQKKKDEDTNPFSALFSFFKSDKEKKSDDEVTPDSNYEKTLRSQAIISAREKCFAVFDVYKKVHNMPSHPSPYDG